MDQDHVNPSTKEDLDDSDALLAARLRHLLEHPGISDKDRRLVERNLKRLLAAHQTSTKG